MSRFPPHPQRATTLVDLATTSKVRALIGRIGLRGAQLKLGVSNATMESLRGRGRVGTARLAEIVAVLDGVDGCGQGERNGQGDE